MAPLLISTSSSFQFVPFGFLVSPRAPSTAKIISPYSDSPHFLPPYKPLLFKTHPSGGLRSFSGSKCCLHTPFSSTSSFPTISPHGQLTSCTQILPSPFRIIPLLGSFGCLTHTNCESSPTPPLLPFYPNRNPPPPSRESCRPLPELDLLYS